MEVQDAINKGLELVNRSKIALLGSNGDNGYPNVKAMLNLENEGLKRILFSTNTSSKRVKQLKENPKACVYYVDENSFMGLMLVGEIEVLQDNQSRERLWKDGCEMYYPLGVEDPDYSVLRFTTKWCNFYQGLTNINFEV